VDFDLDLDIVDCDGLIFGRAMILDVWIGSGGLLLCN
jgi:hypothetical protein